MKKTVQHDQRQATVKNAATGFVRTIEKSSVSVVFDIGSLADHLANLTDRRHRRGIRYQLLSILLLTILAMLGDEDHPSGIADWVRHRGTQLRAAFYLSVHPGASP